MDELTLIKVPSLGVMLNITYQVLLRLTAFQNMGWECVCLLSVGVTK